MRSGQQRRIFGLSCHVSIVAPPLDWSSLTDLHAQFPTASITADSGILVHSPPDIANLSVSHRNQACDRHTRATQQVMSLTQNKSGNLSICQESGHNSWVCQHQRSEGDRLFQQRPESFQVTGAAGQ